MVIQAFRPRIGGAELQLERLLPHLARAGVSPVVLTRAQPGAPRFERLGAAVVRRTAIAGDGRAASAVYLAVGLAHLVRRQRQIDVVHAHGILSEGTLALAATFLGIPAVLKILRTGPAGDFALLSRQPAGRLRTHALIRRGWFVAVTREVEDELVELGVPRSRIFSIPNGVDVDVFRPARPGERESLRAELGLRGGVLAVFAGRLIDVKRVDLLLRAVADVPSVRVAIVGDGPDRRRLEALARDVHVDERVTFVGASDRIADYLRAADFFCLPSRAEGLSNALLEAMASGLACVSAPVSGARELLADGRGVVVQDATVASWARALADLARDDERRGEMGRRAHDHARERLSLERTAASLADAYRTVRERRVHEERRRAT